MWMPAQRGQASVQAHSAAIMNSGWEEVGEDGDKYVVTRGVLRRRHPLGPPLPKKGPCGEKWADMARDWYAKFRVSPQAELITTDVEWLTVQQAAGLLHRFEDTGNPKYWVAFNNLASKMGVTPLDRRKLRVKVADTTTTSKARTAAEDAEQSDYDEEFDRLMGQV